jgi:hypothetical protein
MTFCRQSVSGSSLAPRPGAPIARAIAWPLVDRVGAKHEQIGAGGLERDGLADEPIAGPLPVSISLQLLDLGEVDRAQRAVGGMKPAETVPGGLVDESVVLGQGLPAHSAQ